MVTRLMKRVVSQYKEWLTRRPYLANCISTGCLMAAGDVIAQTVVEKNVGQYSLMRTARMTFLGFAFVSPAVLTFYRVMEKYIGPSKPMLKVLIDQGMFAPSMLFFFMPALDLLSGFNLEYARGHLSDDYFSVLKANWMFWPAVQIINFTLLPIALRVVFVQVVALMWNTYLTWKLHSHHEPQEHKK